MNLWNFLITLSLKCLTLYTTYNYFSPESREESTERKIDYFEVYLSYKDDSQTLHAKMAMYNGTLTSVFDQVLIRYPCFCFFKLFIFNSSGFPKITCAFLANKNQWRNIWIKYFPILFGKRRCFPKISSDQC